MKIIKGDLLTLASIGEFHYIMHGCNCFTKMGAGIAAQIATRFPDALEADKAYTERPMAKLGNYSVARIRDATSFKIVNLYTQYKPGADFKLWALESALYKIYKDQKMTKATLVGVPLIGCGIGGGKREEVLRVFREYSSLIDLTVVEYEAEPEKTR